jgi:hypothetical protein
VVLTTVLVVATWADSETYVEACTDAELVVEASTDAGAVVVSTLRTLCSQRDPLHRKIFGIRLVVLNLLLELV